VGTLTEYLAAMAAQTMAEGLKELFPGLAS